MEESIQKESLQPTLEEALSKKSSYRLKMLPTIIIGVVMLGTVLCGLYFYFGTRDTNDKKTQPIALVPQKVTQSPVLSVPPTSNPTSIHFVSQKLGLSFNHVKQLETSPAVPVKTLDEGNKVYVYADNQSDPHTGQWVEVFQKEKHQTLAQAIQQQFLQNYSEKDCFVSQQSTYPDNVKLPASYEIAEITFPKTQSADVSWWGNAEKCPETYTTTNGISYFLMDKNHPEKFVYFSIGQYGIPADTTDDKILWQDTFRFTE